VVTKDFSVLTTEMKDTAPIMVINLFFRKDNRDFPYQIVTRATRLLSFKSSGGVNEAHKRAFWNTFVWAGKPRPFILLPFVVFAHTGTINTTGSE